MYGLQGAYKTKLERGNGQKKEDGEREEPFLRPFKRRAWETTTQLSFRNRSGVTRIMHAPKGPHVTDRAKSISQDYRLTKRRRNRSIGLSQIRHMKSSEVGVEDGP